MPEGPGVERRPDGGLVPPTFKACRIRKDKQADLNRGTLKGPGPQLPAGGHSNGGRARNFHARCVRITR